MEQDQQQFDTHQRMNEEESYEEMMRRCAVDNLVRMTSLALLLEMIKPKE